MAKIENGRCECGWVGRLSLVASTSLFLIWNNCAESATAIVQTHLKFWISWPLEESDGQFIWSWGSQFKLNCGESTQILCQTRANMWARFGTLTYHRTGHLFVRLIWHVTAQKWESAGQIFRANLYNSSENLPSSGFTLQNKTSFAIPTK